MSTLYVFLILYGIFAVVMSISDTVMYFYVTLMVIAFELIETEQIALYLV